MAYIRCSVKGQGGMMVLVRKLIVSAMFFLIPFISLSAQGNFNILILTSYGDGRPGVEALLSGFMTTITGKGVSVEQVYTEHLDLQRNKDKAFLSQLASTLRTKYLSRRVDIIYVLEQPALDFLMSNLRGIAPGATVITARATLSKDASSTNWRFLHQLDSYDIKRTIGLALSLFPLAKEFLFIAGNTSSDRLIAAQAIDVLKAVAPNMAYRDTAGMAFEAVKALIASPPASSLILVLPYNADASGKTTVQMEVAFMAASIASAPVFTLWDNPVGRGAVGGAVTDFFQVGKQAGLAAIDRLAHPETMGSGDSTLASVSTLKLDWKQIRRWGGRITSLPAECVFINRPLSLWDEYRSLVITIIVFILAQSGLIIALLVQRAKRIKTQKNLAESREDFRRLMEQAPEAIVVYDIARERFVDANAKAEELFGCDRASIFERGIQRFYSPNPGDGQSPSKSFAENVEGISTDTPLTLRRMIRNAVCEDRICEFRLVKLPTSEGIMIRGSIIDITARVRAEESTKQSLREKEVLLQEVYHRTKNNMQVIAALLDMQAMQIEDEGMKSILSDMEGRIRAMSLVHQKLYQSKDLSRIDLKDYIQDLVAQVSSSMVRGKTKIAVRLNLEDGIVSTLDIAMPCGLVINELLSNIYKHAYGPEREGTIKVVLERLEDQSVRLSLSDDGKGFPAGFDPHRDGKMGLMTVFSIVELQLHGNVEYSNDHGTMCVVSFKNNLYSPRI